jgi:hypothetical protein
MVTEHCESYMNAATQQAKKETCEKIIRMVRGRFLRLDVLRKVWVEINEEAARIKVAQAFQYRQRRLNQKDSSSAVWTGNDSPKKDRKRKLNPVSSVLPNHNQVAMYPSMRCQQPSDSEDNTASIDEIRWVLGMQPSLPQQQTPLHHSNNAMDSFSNMNYDADDVAIGIPAAMRALPNEQFAHRFVQPADDFNDFMERMRRNSILSSSSANDPESTARLLRQSNFQQQQQQFFPAQQGHVFLERQLQPPQAVQQYDGLNWQQGQSASETINAFFPITLAAARYASQVTIAESLDRSIQTQGTIPLGNSINLMRNNLDEFGTIAANSDEMRSRDRSLFDSSFPLAFSEFIGGSCNSAQEESQIRNSPPNTEQYYPTGQYTLFLDPLPLNDTEIVQSNDKNLEHMSRNKKGP